MRGLLLAAVLGAASVAGCGGVYYSVNVSEAQARLEQARAMGADRLAPYEFTYAQEHLRQAQVEAAEASYSDAAAYAEVAEHYAQKAIDRVQAGRREGVER